MKFCIGFEESGIGEKGRCISMRAVVHDESEVEGVDVRHTGERTLEVEVVMAWGEVGETGWS